MYTVLLLYCLIVWSSSSPPGGAVFVISIREDTAHKNRRHCRMLPHFFSCSTSVSSSCSSSAARSTTGGSKTVHASRSSTINRRGRPSMLSPHCRRINRRRALTTATRAMKRIITCSRRRNDQAGAACGNVGDFCAPYLFQSRSQARLRQVETRKSELLNNTVVALYTECIVVHLTKHGQIGTSGEFFSFFYFQSNYTSTLLLLLLLLLLWLCVLL